SIAESLVLNINLDPGLKYINIFDLMASVNIVENEAFINHIVLEGKAGQLYADGEIEDFFTAPVADLKYEYRDFPGVIEDNGFFIEGAPELNGKIRTKGKKLDITVLMNMAESGISYKDIFKKPSGERLRLQSGFSYHLGNVDINWYLLETSGGALSGTGTIFKTGDTVINLIGEDIDLKELRNNFLFIKKYIAKGNMSTRSVLEKTGDEIDMKVAFDIDNLGIINFEPLADLYKKLTDKSKSQFNINSVQAKLKLTPNQLAVDDLQLKGGDVEGSGKGYYEWRRELDFTLYPRIEGRRIGLRVYGSTDNVKIGLK
ncbi:MAG: AsmA-like C-terminal region-containing protein, partial [Elusimicrobiota bacterium]|nr:AsmA-like C-terminal region-containing protein [Elusimicrobiota bacterium]